MVTGSRKENASKKLLALMAGSVFLAKPGPARYQMQAFSASLPDAPAWSAAIAQLVEHVIRNDGVTGSNPVCGTNNIKHLDVWRTIMKNLCPQGVRNANAGWSDCPSLVAGVRSASRRNHPAATSRVADGGARGPSHVVAAGAFMACRYAA
jgi:hypothetical protein